MEKLTEGFKKIAEKIKGLSKIKKIAIVVAIVGVISAIILGASYSAKNKYGLLFSGLSTEDSNSVYTKLQTDKVDTMVKGNAIYVPKAKVDELRLQLASSITGGSKGYELLDSANKFGSTDEEFKITKKRVTEGELEKTIKSFPQVENAKVLITLAETSAFVKDVKPAKASVYVSLKNGNSLSVDQVRSIVALISGSVENLPNTNVQVIDNKLTLLSQGIFEDDENANAAKSGFNNSALDKQKDYKKDFEKKLENNLVDILEPVFGPGKVKAKVNADLDFDATQQTSITYDPNKVELSTHTIKETNTTNGGAAASGGPIDNNMTNTQNNTNGSNTSTKDEATINNAVGQTEKKTVKAPGAVRRMTASVVVDGQLAPNVQTQIQDIVSGVVNYDANRGDTISVLGSAFDTTIADNAQKQFDQLQQEKVAAQRRMVIGSSIAAGVVLLGLMIILIAKKRRKRREELEKLRNLEAQMAAKEVVTDGEDMGNAIDVVLKDEIADKEIEHFNPLGLGKKTEQSHMEEEIKKYASEKPDLVADLIKTWLIENER
jgi:flagellar M-ring protein FliF